MARWPSRKWPWRTQWNRRGSCQGQVPTPAQPAAAARTCNATLARKVLEKRSFHAMICGTARPSAQTASKTSAAPNGGTSSNQKTPPPPPAPRQPRKPAPRRMAAHRPTKKHGRPDGPSKSMEPPMSSPKISVKNLYKVFASNPSQAIRLLDEGRSKDEIFAQTGQVVGINKVSFDVLAGEIYVLMGLSGSGKSTLIRLINRLVEPSGGSINIDGLDIAALSQAELVK